MNGWVFAGWALAVLGLYAIITQARRHREDIDRLVNENGVLWDQINRFNDAWSEQRARQAVTN